MKRFILILMTLICFVFFINAANATEKERIPYVSTGYLWHPKSSDLYKTLEKNKTQLKNKTWGIEVTAPTTLKNEAKELLNFLVQHRKRLKNEYGLEKGPITYHIPLLSENDVANQSIDLNLENLQPLKVQLPFVYSSENDTFFAYFKLLQSIIRTELAFGNPSRLPLSRHAESFADGFSGWLAIVAQEQDTPNTKESLIRWLTIESKKKRSLAPYQTSLHKDHKKISGVEGFDRFMDGIQTSRTFQEENDRVIFSEAHEVLAFFKMENEIGKKLAPEILAKMKKNSSLWKITPDEDNFCSQYVGFGCKDPAIDATRADIILTSVTGKNWRTWKQEAYKKSLIEHNNISAEDDLPGYPEYKIIYPKQAGAFESAIDLGILYKQIQINSDEIVENESLSLTGGYLNFGLQDEAYRMKMHFSYISGEKDLDETIKVNNSTQLIPGLLYRNDMLIGSQILDRGRIDGYVQEYGLYFHWSRTRRTWNFADISGATTDEEYIHRSYYLASVNTYQAYKLNDFMEVGVHGVIEAGGVNHTGNTLIARNEKYNKDTSQVIIGATIGPRIRLSSPLGGVELTAGADWEYFYQPVDDEGGSSSSSDNKINATQKTSMTYLQLGVNF